MQTSKVLCFNASGEQLRRLSACAEQVNAVAVAVPQADFSQTLGALLDILPRENEVCFAPFPQQMIVMCFERSGMESFLNLLKQEGVAIPYKAMLTPTNLMWRCDALAAELVKEHEAFRKAAGENK